MFTVNRFCLLPAFVGQSLSALQDAKMSWARGSLHSSWAGVHGEERGINAPVG